MVQHLQNEIILQIGNDIASICYRIDANQNVMFILASGNPVMFPFRKF